ncbi:protein of unknown function [Agreia bicolorata]|uniref:DUF4166 domain-containing protein n=1 Tax=Agreia bicolorata TaxID=110935 RepID=A0A1T4XCE5_9MICO|nr:DUF4166 domain-containing protein [Agreia bicolorata]SKA86835.1 protein of unknown function [Agreia bicolorata]
MSVGRRSVYQALLGDRVALLQPELSHYVGGAARGEAGIGSGVYEFAGPSKTWLVPLFAATARADALFGDRSRDVGLTVVNVPHSDAHGRLCLSSTRSFAFAGVTRTMQDTMLAGRDGLLHDFLGRTRFLEVSLRLSVSPEGWLRMRSVGTWLWLGRLRVPVPRILSARVDLLERWDTATASQRVDVTLTHPVFGRVFEYRGSFVYDPRAGSVDDVDTARINRRY